MSEATNQTIESYVNLYTKFFQELTQEYGFSFSISEALNGIQHISDPLDVEDVLYTMQGALCHTKEECDTFEAVFCRRFLQYSYAPIQKKHRLRSFFCKTDAFTSGPPGARTPHTLIKSQVLYQMS